MVRMVVQNDCLVRTQFTRWSFYSDEQMKTGAGTASSMLPVPEDTGGICT